MFGFLSTKASNKLNGTNMQGSYGKTVISIIERMSEAITTAVSNIIKENIGQKKFDEIKQKQWETLLFQTAPMPADNTGNKNNTGGN